MTASGHPAPLDVGVVGTGRVGYALGKALSNAGHRIVAASGVSDASVERIALLGARPAAPPDVLADSGLVLLTVPDDALGDLVAGLVATGAPLAGKLLVHASGRYGIGVLDPAVRAGAVPLALHPAMTFTGRPEDVARLAACPFGVTAPDDWQLVADALVLEMGGEPVRIAEENRGLYHAALSIGANHVVTLVAEAARLLSEAGVERPDRMLGPLAGAALDNALRLGISGLTGPVPRGDAGTVADHLAELRAHAPDALPVYRALTRLGAARALDAGLLKPADAERLLDVLAGGDEHR